MVLKKIYLILSLVFLLTLAGCAGVSKEQAEKSKTAAEPMTENMLQAIKSENYEEFSKDFDEAMKKGIDEKSFKELTSMLKEKIGNYVSKEFWKVDKSGSYMAVFFNAKFDKESADVVIRSVLSEKDGNYKVSGFFLDSPNLRKK